MCVVVWWNANVVSASFVRRLTSSAKHTVASATEQEAQLLYNEQAMFRFTYMLRWQLILKVICSGFFHKIDEK